jgi:hypothetical protein
MSSSATPLSERLSPRPLRHRKPEVRIAVSKTEGSRRKPLLRKPKFISARKTAACRGGFRRDLGGIEGGERGLKSFPGCVPIWSGLAALQDNCSQLSCKAP